jgi:hypothetical protein
MDDTIRSDAADSPVANIDCAHTQARAFRNVRLKSNILCISIPLTNSAKLGDRIGHWEEG